MTCGESLISCVSSQEAVTLLRIVPANSEVSLLICRPDEGVLPPINSLVSAIDGMLISLICDLLHHYPAISLCKTPLVLANEIAH